MDLATRERSAAIVGIHEYPSRDVQGKISPLQIKAACAARALEDAGLTWRDVDAIYDAGEAGPMSGFMISEYFGIKPNVIDTTNVALEEAAGRVIELIEQRSSTTATATTPRESP